MPTHRRSLARNQVTLFCLAFLIAGCDPLSLASLFDSKAAGTSVLTLLETDGRTLEYGDVVRGALSASDFIGLNESYLEAWALEGKPGQTYSIDLVSDDFDSRLYVVGPGLTETMSDDDSGGACHSRIGFTVLERGTFHVVASSSSSRQTGTYEMRVSETPGPRVAMSCGGIDGSALTALSTTGRLLQWGETAFGSLTGAEVPLGDGRPVQAWLVQGTAGQAATIRLQSDDYDSYLYFFGPGLVEAMTDDDGGSGLNSEITVTFPETGMYTVGAGALSSGAVGSYRLTVLDPVDLATLATGERVLYIDSEAYGTLTEMDETVEGRLVQAWAIQVRAGQRVTIEQMSDDFDSYLQVVGPGLGAPLTDDDGGDELDSRLDVTFPESGLYRIIAGSLGGSAGAFSLHVR